MNGKRCSPVFPCFESYRAVTVGWVEIRGPGPSGGIRGRYPSCAGACGDGFRQADPARSAVSTWLYPSYGSVSWNRSSRIESGCGGTTPPAGGASPSSPQPSHDGLDPNRCDRNSTNRRILAETSREL